MHQKKWWLSHLEMPEPREIKLKRKRWRLGIPCIAGMKLLIMLGLFLYSGPLLRLVDPTSASLDAGVISILLCSMLLVDASVVSAWLMIRLIRDFFPVASSWDVDVDKLITEKITPCLETKLLVGSFWGLVLLGCLGFWVLL